MKKNKLTLAILAVFAFILVTMQSCKKEELDASDNNSITKEYNNRSGSTYSFGFSSDTIKNEEKKLMIKNISTLVTK